VKLDEQVRERLAALIEKGQQVMAIERNARLFIEMHAEWRSQSTVLLRQIFGTTHAYTENFEALVSARRSISATEGLGILRAALDDVEQGYLSTLEEMASAEVFADFLEQADHLLSHGYSAPAASLAGAVLENGLRSLAERNDIAVKARDDLSALNSKIAAKGVYNRLRQKQVAVWIDVRNAADHGRFDDFRESDVADLIRGTRDFLAERM